MVVYVDIVKVNDTRLDKPWLAHFKTICWFKLQSAGGNLKLKILPPRIWPNAFLPHLHILTMHYTVTQSFPCPYPNPLSLRFYPCHEWSQRESKRPISSASFATGICKSWRYISSQLITSNCKFIQKTSVEYFDKIFTPFWNLKYKSSGQCIVVEINLVRETN